MPKKQQEEVIVRSSRTSKMIGYCSNCDLSLSDFDEVSSSEYKCPRCSLVQSKEQLKEIVETRVSKNKKEYLGGGTSHDILGDFYMNKSTTEYNRKKAKKEIVDDNDEENTFD